MSMWHLIKAMQHFSVQGLSGNPLRFPSRLGSVLLHPGPINFGSLPPDRLARIGTASPFSQNGVSIGLALL